VIIGPIDGSLTIHAGHLQQLNIVDAGNGTVTIGLPDLDFEHTYVGIDHITVQISPSGLFDYNFVGNIQAAPIRVAFEFLMPREVLIFEIDGVPDFDQRRVEDPPLIDGLPNDGRMWCVPTAALNWMGYIAEHGYPQVVPGSRPWDYGFITEQLVQMGTLMGTDPITGSGDGAPAAQAWLNAYAPGHFVVSSYYAGHPEAGHSYWPTLYAMVLHAVQGNLINPAVGWYARADSDIVFFERKGGHAFSLVEANVVIPAGIYPAGEPTGFELDSPHDWQMGIHDPASGGSWFSQSPFTKDVYTVAPGGHRMVEWSDDDSHADLDYYLSIRPVFGLTASHNVMHLHFPVQLMGPLPPTRSFMTATGANVTDLAIHPERLEHAYLVENSDVIWQIDSSTGESRPLATAKGPKSLLFAGPAQELFVVEQSGLARFSRDGRFQERVPLVHPLDEVAYDEASDRLMGLSTATGELHVFDRDLRLIQRLPLPQALVNPQEPRPLAMAGAGDGSLWLYRVGGTQVTSLQFSANGSAQMQALDLGVTQIDALTVTDLGHLLVSDAGLLKEFDAQGLLVENSPFHDLPGGSVLDVLRSFNNFDPQIHTGPAYHDVIPWGGIEGVAFEDTNSNGRRDADEPGLSGWTMTLHRGDDESVAATTVTDAEGRYQFDVFFGTQHHVHQHLPEGWRQTTVAPGLVSAPSGEVVTGIDFGNARLINDAPVTVDDSATTTEDNGVIVPVLVNDTDDGPSSALFVSIASVTAPANGALLVIDGNGDGLADGILYTPAANFHGTDSFTYQASDGALLSNVATVTITVQGVNDPPVARADQYTVIAGTTLVVPAPGVLANDTDADGDPLSARFFSAPAHGTLALSRSDGSFVYTPNTGYVGPDTFEVEVSDAFGAIARAVVSLEVTPPPDPVYDFGDAPDDPANPNDYPTLQASGGPSHSTFVAASLLMLGVVRDAEFDGQPSNDALGDDLSNHDEDGAWLSWPAIAGKEGTFNVTVTGAGYVNAWVDWNADHDWTDPGEQIATDVFVSSTTASIPFLAPLDAAVGTTYARFRVAGTPGLTFRGPADDGEVEDYALAVAPSDVDMDLFAGLLVVKTAGHDLAIRDAGDGRITVSLPQTGWQHTFMGIDALELNIGIDDHFAYDFVGPVNAAPVDVDFVLTGAVAEHLIYQVSGVPDFDQWRTEWETAFGTSHGLPFNGLTHCGPTAAMNWMAYLAAQGYAVGPGPGPWDPTLHDPILNLDRQNAITASISALADMAGYNPVTNQWDGRLHERAAMEDWLNAFIPGYFVVSWTTTQTSSNYWEIFDDMVRAATEGALVNPQVTWYANGVKDGEHIVSMVEAEYYNPGPTQIGKQLIGIHNPYPGGSPYFQESFTKEVYGVYDGYIKGSQPPRSRIWSAAGRVLCNPDYHGRHVGF
jgi:hypothetical protein